jgi:hypothetical protein
MSEMQIAETKKGSLGSLPTSRLGRWSMWLAVAFVVMFAINTFVFMPISGVKDPTVVMFRTTVLPFYGVGMMLCGAIAGVVGLMSIIKDHERSWVVWLTIVPMAFVIFFVLGEFLVPH